MICCILFVHIRDRITFRLFVIIIVTTIAIITNWCYAPSVFTCIIGGAIQMTVYDYDYDNDTRAVCQCICIEWRERGQHGFGIFSRDRCVGKALMVVTGSSKYTVVILGRWLTDEVYRGCGVTFLLRLEPWMPISFSPGDASGVRGGDPGPGSRAAG